MKTLFGRKVAVDASMSIYQFLIAVRQKDGEMLTNDAGETTRCVDACFPASRCKYIGLAERSTLCASSLTV